MASIKTKKTDKQILDDKAQATMNLVIKKASYFRSNPHRLVEEMWGIHLKLFQKILLWCFMFYNYSFYLAARG